VFVVVLGFAFPAAAGADDESPHHSTTACPVCHTEDMGLQRSELETCTLCHAETVHSGAVEHQRLDGAHVTQALAARKDDGGVTLPLADNGRIWCGTCHLFHDPSLGEAWLPMGWIPPDTGLAEAVREGVVQRWDAMVSAHGQATVDASFATKGTRALRLPVQDGTLCTHCHGSAP
jgi:hypothetical protein